MRSDLVVRSRSRSAMIAGSWRYDCCTWWCGRPWAGSACSPGAAPPRTPRFLLLRHQVAGRRCVA